MDLSVTLKGQSHDLKLKNPVLTASGTFGYGVEFASYGDLAALGGIVVKGLSLQPREGNPCPRIVETTAGMLNAVGLQNDGVEAFCRDKLPRLPWRETPVIVNMYATSPAEFGELAARLDGEEGVAALEVNVSCPNVREGGVLFGQDPRLAAAVTAQAARGQGDMLTHAEQYAAQTGQDLGGVLARFGLEEPEIPEGFEVVWEWFWELASGRGHTGFAWLPLSWTEMDAWARMSGVDLQPWLAGIFRAMDRAWLAEAARQQKKGK